MNKVTQARLREPAITAAMVSDGAPGAARRGAKCRHPPPDDFPHNFPEPVRVITALTAALTERGPYFPGPRFGL